MKCKLLLLLLSMAALLLSLGVAQHEDIPYQAVANICETCTCLSAQDNNHRLHQTLNCAMKNFAHILARWPPEFGSQHAGMEIVASYSGNNIRLLQQLPATNATLTFSCRHCGMQQLQEPLFMDVPNVEGLYLSWNEIADDALHPALFRGPFNATRYEPIALKDLDLSHNRISRLDRKLFEHTPQLRKLALAYNRLSVLDAATTASLASITNLERLDLSHNGLLTLPAELFSHLNNLYQLDISGNEFAVVPASIQQLGKSLLHLNLAGNPLAKIDAHSFQQLEALRRLNISEIVMLRTIELGALQLPALEQLDCARNPKLERLELSDLRHSRNLTQLDISQNALTTLTLNVSGNATNASWPRLRSLAIAGNPWYCSCELLQALEHAGAPQVLLQPASAVARCDTPYLLAGLPLTNLTAEQICNMVIPKKYRAVEDDPPRFLRRRYIILTVIIASVVVVAGLIIGFIVVCVRRRLKGNDYGVQPIRYTSVRGSNLSAFSQLQPASVTSKFNNAAANTGTTTGAPNA
ncbi:carboxypeptidase N subunit 2 isoform X1 [Drosophila novamexicana]|uniref:carboxypeptidase N subunit 2 isoform X1 n=2 Tax=Drosophila novamexicana TaxID=47314 RepID=UPI0011E5FE7C|nr:carboxypeptidase N subunit 2 isoform X1 [Drosophila novamexicana]XP_030559373.1 carboxypeptidase N subunit 2 isoform X1 [Drosophila novamexicana]